MKATKKWIANSRGQDSSMNGKRDGRVRTKEAVRNAYTSPNAGKSHGPTNAKIPRPIDKNSGQCQCVYLHNASINKDHKCSRKS